MDETVADFSIDPAGLPACGPTEVVELGDGDTWEITIAPVANRVGDAPVRMLAYSGSIPGPTLRVRQGSEAAVRVRNEGDHETTVHWHGLRVANEFDGVAHGTQAPIPVGGEFTYRLRFPDDGVYWYHPHVREDYGLEMGLYGNILVDPADPDTWPPVNREAIVTLDDLLIEDGKIAPFHRAGPTHTAMGRFGNVMLVAGSTHLHLSARVGDVVRFFFTNTANTRIFNVTIPGVRMKLVGGDSGRHENEEWVDAVLLAPSERAIVDVLFPSPGERPLHHRTPDHTYVLGVISVAEEPASASYRRAFETLHSNDDLVAERARLPGELERPPDKTLVFDARMPLLYGDTPALATAAWTCPMHPEVLSEQPGRCPTCGMKLVPAEPAAARWTCPMHPEVVSEQPGSCPTCGMKLVPAEPPGNVGASTRAGGEGRSDADHEARHVHEGHGNGDGLEWEDLMPDMNAQSDATNMVWKLVDADTGKENQAIDWAFRVGDRVKIRLVNTLESDHPMHHPFHIHGAGRFLVLSRGGVPEPNLVWKDTVLVRAGETVDILLDVTNPGLWMAHCHIAEHNQVGMMFSFQVN